MSNHNNNQQSSPINNVVVNPYAILNTPNNASIEEIQKSYKLLSRSFHPDKQPIQNREDAQQYFIQLKGAYDILMDPVHKFVYDYFGYDGVLFLKRQSKLYDKLFVLLRTNGDDGSDWGEYNNSRNHAKILVSEAMQFYTFQTSSMKLNKPKITGSVKVKCNTTHSALLHEGVEPLSLDVDESNIALSISQAPSLQNNNQRKLGYTFGTSSSLNLKGEGGTNGNISLQYEPVQGTDVHANVSTELFTRSSSGYNKKMQKGKSSQRQIKPKITVGSSRIMSNMTYVHASVSAPLLSLFNIGMFTTGLFSNDKRNKIDDLERQVESSDESNSDWLVSFTTHRSLFEDKFQCTWISGISIPDTRLRYGMISISTSGGTLKEDEDDETEEEENKEQQDSGNQTGKKQRQHQQHSKKSTHPKHVFKPIKYTLKLNLGMNHTPLQVSAIKELSEKQTGVIVCGYGPMGIDIRIVSTRIMSKFCKLSLGVRHVAATGLSALFQVERSGINFNVPILVSTAASREYAIKTIYVTLFMSLLDAIISENLNENDILRKSKASDTTLNELQSMTGKKLPLRTHEDKLLEKEKKRRDRAQQIQLMSRSARLKMDKEQRKEDGLVILMARYEIIGGESIDVTIALQFWVMNSSLHLPSMTKSNMLGFYDVRRDAHLPVYRSFWNRWSKIISPERLYRRKKPKHDDSSSPIPTLTVRYRYGPNVYEITVFDHEELSIPSGKAMKLGGSFVS